jgi:transposase-like protein
MSKQNKRRNSDGNFKANVALEAIELKMTLSELVVKYDIFTTQITYWKKEFLANSGSKLFPPDQPHLV